ncbi:hypothetical protein CK203_034733 [Vitis vinifera]|uniref:Uncharacterized protein n=1 Tax=Vitis vinifera TaxID=29760 RepID=A0A438HWD7_VITVI|nr:hypothetical protein CK203_034733 [Vitis vinifera]
MVKTAMTSEGPASSLKVISDSTVVNSGGLSKNLDEVRGRVLSTKPLHHSNRRVLKSGKEDSQKKVMMKDHTSSQSFPSNNKSALATKDRILNTLIHEGDPIGCGVIIVIELVTLEKPIGKFIGSRPIWKSNRTQENEP